MATPFRSSTPLSINFRRDLNRLDATIADFRNSHDTSREEMENLLLDRKLAVVKLSQSVFPLSSLVGEGGRAIVKLEKRKLALEQLQVRTPNSEVN